MNIWQAVTADKYELPIAQGDTCTELADDYEKHELSENGWLETTYIPSHRMGAAALRGPEPDPDTGLVLCGCGGKAEICGSSGDDESYSLECWECGTSSGCYDTKKEAKAAWNRAMGYKEDA